VAFLGARAPAGEGRRDSERLEAFSDGVMAVIITIMVLGLRVPGAATAHSLSQSLPSLLVYVLSFTVIGIYWNNHHHLLRSTERISGAVMWSNLHLLFWLSLIPVLTEWVAKFYRSHLPASAYGVVTAGAATAYWILVRAIIRCNGEDSVVARAVGNDVKGKVSILLYLAGIGVAWATPWIAYGFYVLVAVVWFIPDRRLTRQPSAESG
jgi:uncharacterized membrane protein